jgi:putative Ca2+/H+ antiporter (TMEM165/GDT1 family)
MIAAFFVAFGTVFLAELPDKTMVASLVLTTKFRRPGPCGSACRRVRAARRARGHARLAAAQLPDHTRALAVAALFLIGGVHHAARRRRGGRGSRRRPVRRPRSAPWRLTAASVVGLAEFGDLTQLATAGIATRYSAPIAVALGAWCALATVAALAVTAGSGSCSTCRCSWCNASPVVCSSAFGVLTAISAFT